MRTVKSRMKLNILSAIRYLYPRQQCNKDQEEREDEKLESILSSNGMKKDKGRGEPK